MTSFPVPFAFLALLFLSGLSSAPTSILLPENSLYQKSLLSTDPIYYISATSSATNSTGTFCQIHQPSFDFLSYSQVFDQTDSSIFANEHHMLGIDNSLIILLKRGVLQLFRIDFSQNSANLYHLNEFLIKSSNLLQEVAENQYVALFYEKDLNCLLILSRQSLAFISLDSTNKTTWFQPFYTAFPNDSTILYARTLKNFLYILRKNSVFEVWKISGFSAISLEKTVNFTEEFAEFKNLAEIVDFEISEEFFCFLEKTSRTFLLMRPQGDFSQLSQKIVKKLTFTLNPTMIELTKSSFFVLIEGSSSKVSYLSRYSVLASDFPLVKIWELKDFRDLYIGEDYMIVSYENNAVLSTFSFIQPEEANAGLEAVFDAKNLRFIEPFIVNAENSSGIHFKVMKDAELQLMTVKRKDAVLSCDTKDAGFGEYALNFEAFMMKCEFLDAKCDKSDRSNYYSEKAEIIVKITKNEEIPQLLARNDEDNGIVTVLTICLCIAFGLIVCCVIYVFKLKRISKQLMVMNQGKYVERVMSKEEIEGMKTLKETPPHTEKSNESV